MVNDVGHWDYWAFIVLAGVSYRRFDIRFNFVSAFGNRSYRTYTCMLCGWELDEQLSKRLNDLSLFYCQILDRERLIRITSFIAKCPYWVGNCKC